MDWKKIIAITVAGVVVPTIGTWAQTCVTGATCPAITAGNVIAPALPTLLSTATALIALFLRQPHK